MPQQRLQLRVERLLRVASSDRRAPRPCAKPWLLHTAGHRGPRRSSLCSLLIGADVTRMQASRQREEKDSGWEWEREKGKIEI